MEYCAHCRAIRPTRKSSRRRTVRQPDGTVKTLIVDSYHCTRCNGFVGSVERDAAPPSAASPAGEPVDAASTSSAGERAAALGEVPAAAAEEVEAATEAPAAPAT
jgi:hypothetical protein